MSADGVFNSPSELSGLTVYGKEGDKIGNVGQVYVDDVTGRPEWVTVKTGMFGMKESLVPLSGGRRMGEDLHVPHTKETVKDAPRLDADEHLDPAQERALYEHYGLSGAGMGAETGAGTGEASESGARADTGTADATSTTDTTAAATGTGTAAAMGTNAGAAAAADTTGGHQAYDPDKAPAASADLHNPEMIRSEEELHVATVEREVGTARLRKVVVTENVTTSVPISHEEVRVIHEPIDPASDAASRPNIGEAETRVTLHAEQPVVRKETVAVERVRLETEKVTEEREVTSDVRKEQIEYDSGRDDKGADGRRDRKGMGDDPMR
ncbi:PRC and DUF2382 domain-containing protein [Streptomyces sp. NBC_01317]|uniref:PRC and DUF2382 domain-containing protein n=1 Tax=Streptomyces sp. NBC_01317 TaxID=2903822 RepID=UPI002E0D0E99|nr:PRC and DUF2382 domain-containing protein [Streptomyces sp. NBC_01317]